MPRRERHRRARSDAPDQREDQQEDAQARQDQGEGDVRRRIATPARQGGAAAAPLPGDRYGGRYG
ncbi:hypothetical protein, partial [Streptomyces pharetrae]|uniref:hypothetical protein n=1 Tax=Streptomyces pharetrae TaxID=291370 RepID=UPI0036A207AA